MEYKILHDYDIPLLENAVSEHLKDGWKPQGGVSVFSALWVQDSEEHLESSQRFVFIQPITKEEI